MGHWHVFRHIRPRVLLLPALAIAAALLFATFKIWIPGLPFFPTKTIAATPADMEMPYGEVRIPTSDGEVLSAWFIPGAPGRGPGAGLTLLFFHGNSGNISSYLRAAAIFHQLGLDVLIPRRRQSRHEGVAVVVFHGTEQVGLEDIDPLLDLGRR